MDTETIKFLAGLLLGGTGIPGILMGIKAIRSRGEGPDDEAEARAVASVADNPHSPEWVAFNAYLQQEIAAIRKEYDGKIQKLEGQLEQVRKEALAREVADGEHIDMLEAWIWQQKPPPPPAKRRR